MAFNKTWVLIALAAAVLSVSTSSPIENEVFATSTPNHLIVGERVYNDELVHQENISVSASLIGKKVILEKTFNTTSNRAITQIRALDQATDGTGATVVVTGGGPGQSTITLRFKSQRFHGIYFNVQLYARARY